MNTPRIVRSNGAWFIQRGKDQVVPEFFKTLEEARRALEEYLKKPEVISVKKEPATRRSVKKS